jgi:hypothetical protein
MAHGEWILHYGECLRSGEYLRSKNGLFTAYLNYDGNFIVGRGDDYPRSILWQSMETDKYRQWAAGNDPGGGPSPGHHIAILVSEPGVQRINFRLYQGVNDPTEIHNYPARMSWWCAVTKDDAWDEKASVVLDWDGNFRSYLLDGRITEQISGQTDTLVSEAGMVIEYDCAKGQKTPRGGQDRSRRSPGQMTPLSSNRAN